MLNMNQTSQVRRILLIEGLLNLLMMIGKLIVGLLSHSAAVTADAIHSLSDVANNCIAWLAVKMSSEPPDKEHPYGHHKFEQLAVFFLASLLTVVAFEMMIHAINRIGEPVQQSLTGLIILFVCLCINIVVTVWERRWARKLNSAILHADATHTFSDVLTTIGVIVGWQLAYQGYPWLDTVFAIVISGLIFYLAFKLFQRAIPILVDQRRLDEDSVKSAIHMLDMVNDVTRVRSRSDGRNIIADITVTVSSQIETHESHQIADAIEKLLADKFSVSDAVVHIEPTKAAD